MAKGLRASTERTNRRKLRATVFGPVEKARADRLHAKLLATIAAEKPARPAKKEEEEETTKDTMDVDASKAEGEEADADADKTDKKPHRKQSEKKSKKERARKPRNSITFPTSRGKGALKPFTGKSRVGKRR